MTFLSNLSIEDDHAWFTNDPRNCSWNFLSEPPYKKGHTWFTKVSLTPLSEYFRYRHFLAHKVYIISSVVFITKIYTCYFNEKSRLKIINFQRENYGDLLYCWSGKDIKGTVVNQTSHNTTYHHFLRFFWFLDNWSIADFLTALTT